jgi:hypothetical protein
MMQNGCSKLRNETQIESKFCEIYQVEQLPLLFLKFSLQT